MMKEWFTSNELVGFALLGLPQNRQGIEYRAKSQIWKSRPRQASGGGFEYHLSNLPASAQVELIKKLAADGVMDSLSVNTELLDLVGSKAPAEVTTKDDLRNAKIIIVSLFEKFLKSTAMNITTADKTFLESYLKQRDAKIYDFVPDWVFAAIPDFSVRSLHRWRKGCEKASLNELSGRYGNRKGSSILNRAEDGKVALRIAATLVAMPQLKAGQVRDFIRAEFGSQLSMKDARTGETVLVPLPKIRSFERHIIEWKAENDHVVRKLLNPDGYKNSHQMALGSQSHAVEGLNDVWEIDASPVDALCQDGRYTLYAIIDVYTRRVLFHVSKTAKTEASLQLIRRAVLEWGIPKVIKTDNGSDFKSKRFIQALMSLRIEQKWCPPYTPEGKPHVERVIKHVQHNLMPLLPGYVGHNVSERSQIEARKTFAQRLGVDDRETFMTTMTRDDVKGYLDKWAADVYAHKEHRGIGGKTPFAMTASWSGEIRRVGSERALDLLLAPIAGSNGLRRITKKAIRINNSVYYGPGLELHVGKTVMVRHDPDDFSKVYVFDEEGQFLCEAKDFEAQSHEDQKAQAVTAKANQKAAIRIPVTELRKAGRDITPEYAVNTILNQANIDRSNLVELPRPSVLHETPDLIAAEEAMADHELIMNPFMPAPVVRQEPKAEMTPQDRWWDRRRSIMLALCEGKEVSDQDREWLTWYESTPQYQSRQHMEDRRNEMNGVKEDA